MRIYGYEKLEVWQLARTFVKSIYQVTRDFPAEERYGLTNQIRRAAVSISSNIVEGSARHSKKDKARFIEIAYGSLMEVTSQLTLAEDLEFLDPELHRDMREPIEELSNKINALHKAFLK